MKNTKMTLRDMTRVVGCFYISRKHVISWIAVILILCGTSVFTACSDDEESPAVHEPTYATLKEALVGINQISLIKADPDQRSVKKKESGKLDYKEQYSMLFRQDLDLDNLHQLNIEHAAPPHENPSPGVASLVLTSYCSVKDSISLGP